jgi:hypothetical protein
MSIYRYINTLRKRLACADGDIRKVQHFAHLGTPSGSFTQKQILMCYKQRRGLLTFQEQSLVDVLPGYRRKPPGGCPDPAEVVSMRIGLLCDQSKGIRRLVAFFLRPMFL